MVYDRIKIIKTALIFILLPVLFIAAFLIKPNIETNLICSVLPQSVSKNTDIIELANKSLSLVKVVFEADNTENLNKIKQSFQENIDKQEFEIITGNFKAILDVYLSAPQNFLSYSDRQLLKNKEYEKLYNSSLDKLYNPIEVQFATYDKDPYFLLNSFLISLMPNSKPMDLNDKNYDYMILKIKDNNGLSPGQSNIKVKELVKLQKALSSCGNAKIYLAGTPIHSYYASNNSINEINIICTLSTLLIIFLIYFYFRNLKLLLPIALSIVFAVLSGFIAVSLLFDTFQTITMVFSTTLIGIGIDYSFHYFFNQKRGAGFIKNLFLGLITTTSAFAFLYLSGIELLQQISVFMTAGLTAIYLFIIVFYPCFNFLAPRNNIHIIIPKKISRPVIIILLICIILGGLKLSFNDSLSAFYAPDKNLKQAEILFNKVSGQDNAQMKMITVSGHSIEDILQKEENITDSLNEQNIEYMALSKYIPSLKRQKENAKLVQELYKNDLKNNDILNDEQIKNLQKMVSAPVSLDIDNYPQLKSFILKDDSSIIFVNTKGQLIAENNIRVVDLNKDISSYLKSYRITLLKLLPFAVFVVWIILFGALGKQYSYKILIPPCFAIISAIGILGLFGQEINLFSVISLFLILGFTIDYSIFTFADGKKSEDAILCSFITTAFAFLLLSFTEFKLITSISLVLFIGISISYICRLLFFSDETEQM